MSVILAFLKGYKFYLIGGVIAFAVIAGGFRMWIVRHDDAVWKKAVYSESKQIEERFKKEYAAKDASLSDKLKLVTAKETVIAEQLKMARSFSDQASKLNQNSKEAYNKTVTIARTTQEVKDANINSIAPSELLNTLRARSAELASAVTPK